LNRRFLLFLTGPFVLAGLAGVACAAPQQAPAGQQPPEAPVPNQTVQPAQVPNMPPYNPDIPTTSQPYSPPLPAAKPPMPSSGEVIQNGPPAEIPLPPPPQLPTPPSQGYVQPPQVPAMKPYKPVPSAYLISEFGSTYIPLDSWIYPAMLRLYSLGYVDSAYIGLRPWTRLSVLHMLARCADQLDAEENDDSQAWQIYDAVRAEILPDDDIGPHPHQGHSELASVYSRSLGITGQPLQVLDSYSVGQTLVNDYGRPYAAGYNNVSGFSTRAEQGRFSFYFRGEYQHAPGWIGFNASQALFLQQLNENIYSDGPQDGYPTLTIPTGPIAGVDTMRVLEADLAVHLAGNEISIGKHDEWMGPSQGGSFTYSNNAEPIYAFQINRVEPLYIPYVSKVLGPMRYNFFVGSLKGHNIPNNPWVHVEKLQFKPTENFEFGLSRTVIWGGRNHEGISFSTFFNSLFSISDTTGTEKCLAHPTSENPNPKPPHLPNCRDPGARFSQFDFSYRLPKLRKWLTWYTDTFVHDDVSPISAPRRSAFRTGLYLSHFPGVPKLDLRVEAASTDPNNGASNAGRFFYWETIQHEGPTNKGVLFTDVIGREDKGGQAWLTYNLSPSEMLQVGYRNTKGERNYLPGGTTQNDYNFTIVKRLWPQWEAKGFFQYEQWNIPFLKPGAQSDTVISGTITWYPKIKVWE
jgi:hypothetical protein